MTLKKKKTNLQGNGISDKDRVIAGVDNQNNTRNT